MEYSTPPVVGNTSGTGPTAIVPEEIKGWNWGAFLLNWIWAIGHQTWIGLLALIPYAGLIMAIILGIKGNEWAWQNRKFDSVEQFREVEKKWTFWGVVVWVVSIVIWLIVVILSVMLAGMRHVLPH